MRAKRIQPIARHADQKQEEAACAFAQSQRELAKAEQQLQQLTTYRDEYGRQLVMLSMNVERLRDYQLFIAKINNALEQANTEINNKKHNCEQKRLAWLKAKTRSKALNFIVDKYIHAESVLQEKRDQKETDEHGARIQGNKDK